MKLFALDMDSWLQGWKDSVDQMARNGNPSIDKIPPSGNGWFNDWIQGWKHSFDIMGQNGHYVAPANGPQLIDICIVVCIVGVIMSIAGINRMGSKLVLGSILAAAIGRVVLNAG